MELSLDQQTALIQLINFCHGEQLEDYAFEEIGELPQLEEALRLASAEDYSGIEMLGLSGPAGSGKTTLLKSLSEYLSGLGWYKKSGGRGWIQLTATTHKAAHVMAEACDWPAVTIHNRLNLKPTKTANGTTKLKQREPKGFDSFYPRVMVVDEASMVDTELLRHIAENAKKHDFKVLFVGDAYQLPPVKQQASPVFEHVPSIHLKTIHRQALENPVLAFATQFRKAIDGEGAPPITALGDTVELIDQEEFEQRLIGEFDNPSAIGNIKALCWTNGRVRQLNNMVRDNVLGPMAANDYNVGEILTTNNPIMIGDRVVVPNGADVEINRNLEVQQLEADGFLYEIERLEILFDGKKHEIQVPVDWDQATQAEKRLGSKARRLQKRFYAGENDLDYQCRQAWRAFYELKEGLADLRPPYASTVHKSQGSTYGRVYIDVGDIGRNTHNSDILRLMYTALTRPKYRVIMTGNLPSRLYNPPPPTTGGDAG